MPEVDKSLSEALADPELVSRCLSVPALFAMRWFGGKDAVIEDIRACDSALLPPSRDRRPAVNHSAVAYVLLMADVRLGGGERASSLQRYFVPLSVLPPTAQGDLGGENRRPLVLGELRTPDFVGVLADGASDPGMAQSVMEAMNSGLTVRGRHGRFVFESTGLEPRFAASEIGPSSTNTIVGLDSRYVLKTFRRLEGGANLEVEIGTALAASGRPHYTVPLAGHLCYVGTDRGAGGAAADRVTLQLCQVYVHNSGNGWDRALAVLGRLYRHGMVRQVGQEEAQADEFVRELLREQEAWALKLGESLARLHVVLAGIDGPQFEPEPATRHDVEEVVASIEQRVGGPLAKCAAALGLVLDSEAFMAEVREAAGRVTRPGVKMRIHGDLHLGQILVCPGRFVFTDFEGEPVETLSTRRRKRSPLCDLAGLLRSYAYAVQAALYDVAESMAGLGRLMAPWERQHALELGRAWQRRVSEASTASYLDTMRAQAPHLLPPSDEDVRALVRLLRLDRLVYEAIYEAANRPSWVRVPMVDLKGYLKETRA